MTRLAGIALLACALAGCGAKPPATQPSAALPGVDDRVHPRPIDRAIAEGVAFLVRSQNPDGSWGTGTVTRGWEVLSAVPGSHEAFRVATTALCAMALRQAGDEGPARGRAVAYLIERGHQARRDDDVDRRFDLLYNVWAHTYALEALAGELTDAAPAAPVERLREAALWHLDRLARHETHVGGWNYYDDPHGTTRPSRDPTSFGTASGLVALLAARDAGLDVPRALIDRAVRRLAEMRLPNGAYVYGGEFRYLPRLPTNLPRGSVGRTQACNYARLLAGDPRMRLEWAIDGLAMFARDRVVMDAGRKRPYPHEGWYQTAGYYYYYGHYHAALLAERLGEDARRRFAPAIAAGVLPYQEPDGSWWDFAMWDYHKPYGTAYAVMTLLRCR